MAGGTDPIPWFPSMDKLAISTACPGHEAGPMALERITFLHTNPGWRVAFRLESLRSSLVIPQTPTRAPSEK